MADPERRSGHSRLRGRPLDENGSIEFQVARADGFERTCEWPDPTPEMLTSLRFDAIWQCIKTWDINVPAAYSGYSGATGNHVRAILDALDNPPSTNANG